MRLNVLLAKTDGLAGSCRSMIKDYGKFFAKKGGAFVGERRTYEPREGYADIPSSRGISLIQTTVPEKLDWFKENSKEYINALFSQEKTNASGTAKAELIVEGESWGELTSLELLRLKSVVEDDSFISMISSIPVRSDAKEWNPNKDEAYSGRAVMESPKVEGIQRSTEKEQYILPDPNIGSLKSAENYRPQVATKSTIIEVGDYTIQNFSGEASQRERAEMLRRRSTLSVAIIEALKKCNECEAVSSNLTSDKIFGYLFG
jgi:hypothetical protein